MIYCALGIPFIRQRVTLKKNFFDLLGADAEVMPQTMVSPEPHLCVGIQSSKFLRSYLFVVSLIVWIP